MAQWVQVDDRLLVYWLLHSVTAGSFLDVLILLVGLLFCSATMSSLVVHGRVVVDKLAKGLFAELG